jgi:LAS superfamily LD-carboxypeptidase LdcB
MDVPKLQTQKLNTVYNESEKDYLLGKFEPASHPDFTKISSTYTSIKGIYLRKEVYNAYKKMYNAALLEKIELQILSATRNFDYQKKIWENKWNILTNSKSKSHFSNLEKSLDILKYSAMPGASRHHWGTDIDLCNLSASYFNTKEGRRVYSWLQKNAHLYGFCQTYNSKKEHGRTGYNEEKWHWSYQPSSKVFTDKAAALIKNTDFVDFLGAETASEIDILNNYILGLNSNCF